VPPTASHTRHNIPSASHTSSTMGKQSKKKSLTFSKKAPPKKKVARVKGQQSLLSYGWKPAPVPAPSPAALPAGDFDVAPVPPPDARPAGYAYARYPAAFPAGPSPDPFPVDFDFESVPQEWLVMNAERPTSPLVASRTGFDFENVPQEWLDFDMDMNGMGPACRLRQSNVDCWVRRLPPTKPVSPTKTMIESLPPPHPSDCFRCLR
jgi:hypothetical protein